MKRTWLPRPVLAPLFAGLFLLAAMPPSQLQADENVTNRARMIVEDMADQVLTSLRDESQTKADRKALYADLFREHFAVPVIGRWVMGRAWREASEAQRREYLQVFENYIVNTYAQQFANFTGERFRITGAEPEREGAVVTSEILSPDGTETTRVRWRMQPGEDGKLQIRDVVIENISMAITQRREFASIYHRRGGVDGLIQALREKVAELESQD